MLRKSLSPVVLLIIFFLATTGLSYAAWQADADLDLMPDSYEVAKGFNPNNAADADQDADGDKLTNLDEFLAQTDPFVSDVVVNDIYTDKTFLSVMQGRAFRFFWEQSRLPYYLTTDRASTINPNNYENNYNSIAGVGFSLVSYVVADHKGWLNHKTAYQRIYTILSRMRALQASSYDVIGNVSNTLKGNRHGYFYHFVTNDGTRQGTSEISTIDHALFVAGALVAGEYFKGTEIEILAQDIFLNTDWDWLWNGSVLYQGWLEQADGPFDGGITLDQWNRYSEAHILLFLAMASTHFNPDHGIPLNAWDLLGGFPNEVKTLHPGDFGYLPSFGGIPVTYTHGGSLHIHQYSHMFSDFRKRPDAFGKNYFDNSLIATLVNRQYCIDIKNTYPAVFETYENDIWGLSAGYRSNGYDVAQPLIPPDNLSLANIEANNDSGTVFPFAHLGSMPFTPTESLAMTRKLYRYWFDQINFYYPAVYGRYGFLNSFNTGITSTGQNRHYATTAVAIDMGPIVGMIENYQSGLLWKLFMRNVFTQNGMQAAGFTISAVEPFILNFDDNPPFPHEDPNGGGQDPHSFGGITGAWSGGASATYVWIGDPFPELNSGPQNYALQINAPAGGGGFITLNSHSVSNWGRLSFWIRGLNGDETIDVGLKDIASTQQTEIKLPLDSYLDSPLTTEWQEVRIPLADFETAGVRLSALDNLSFTLAADGGVEIDDIAFLPDEFAPAAPVVTTAKRENNLNILEWEAPEESDVVGYNIYASVVSGGPYTKLTSQVLVDLRYEDTAPQSSPQTTYYYLVEVVDNAVTPNATQTQEIAIGPGAPTVVLQVSTAVIEAGQPFQITLTATASAGLKAAWWFVEDVNTPEFHPIPGKVNGLPVNLAAAQDFITSDVPQGATFAQYTRTVIIDEPGGYLIKANARDLLYPVPGEPHQASEGSGLAVVPIENQAPIVLTQRFPRLRAGKQRYKQLKYKDPEDDAVSVQIIKQPRFVAFDARHNLFTFRPKKKDAGKHILKIRLMDAKGAKTIKRYVLQVRSR